MLALVCLLSGAAALILETIWFRAAGLVVGNSILASSLVSAAFMTGLGLGSLIALKFTARPISRPTRIYSLVETGIGLGGLGVALLLVRLPAGLAPMFQWLGDTPWAPLAKFAAMFSLLALPSTLMGATLPLLAAASNAQAKSAFAKVAGSLYAWNTFGAFVGALAGELLLIQRFGIRGTAVFATCLSLVAAALALLLRVETSSESDAPQLRSPLAGAWRPLTTALGAGLALMALEIVWFRLIILLVDSTSRAFTAMLAVVLLGIALGSRIGAALARWTTRPDAWLAAVAALAALATPMTYWTFDPRLRAPSEFAAYLLISARLMGPTTLLSGAMFTLTGVAVRRSFSTHGQALSALTLANTVGAAVGPLLATFILIPKVGVETSIFLLSLVYLLLALINLTGTALGAERRVTAALVLMVGVVLALFPFGLMQKQFHRWALTRAGAGGLPVVAFREGIETTVTYVQAEVGGEPWYHRLVTNSHSMSASDLVSRRYMKLFVYLPVWLRGGIKDALLICFGVGNTARGLVEVPGIERIEVVDLSPEILALSPIPSAPRASPLSDGRVHTTVEDGRFFLQTTQRRYDLITGEPPPPRNAGVINLYSTEFFTLVRDRLTDRGIASYWLPVHQLTERDAQGIVGAFCSVFADCSLWLGGGNDWILIGTRAGARLRSADSGSPLLWEHPESKAGLDDLGLTNAASMAALFLGDARFLKEFAAATPPLVDNWPQRLSSVVPKYNQPIYDHAAQWQDRWARYKDSVSLLPFALPEGDLLADDFRRESFARSLVTGLDSGEIAGLLIALAGGSDQRVLRLQSVGFDLKAADIVRRAVLAGRTDSGLDVAEGLRAFGEGRWEDAITRLRGVKEPLRPEHQVALVASLCFAGRVEEADQSGTALKAAGVCSKNRSAPTPLTPSTKD